MRETKFISDGSDLGLFDCWLEKLPSPFSRIWTSNSSAETTSVFTSGELSVTDIAEVLPKPTSELVLVSISSFFRIFNDRILTILPKAGVLLFVCDEQFVRNGLLMVCASELPILSIIPQNVTGLFNLLTVSIPVVTMQEVREKFDVNDVLKTLLDKDNRKRLKKDGIKSFAGTKCLLSEFQINNLIERSTRIFKSQPTLLYLSAPVNICGDIHGQFNDLIWWFKCGGFPPRSNYLFLGNYVDHGKHSLECISLLLAYKIKYPENFFLLRGNHETTDVSQMHGFMAECTMKFNSNMWKSFMNCFNHLPLAAVVEHKIFCCHGGLNPHLKSISQILDIERPVEIPTDGLLCDLVWSDPRQDSSGWIRKQHGVSYTFGADVVNKFLDDNGLSLICRGHQVVDKGYNFFAHTKLITIFSAPSFRAEYDNDGACMKVDPNLVCSLTTLHTEEYEERIPIFRI